MARVARHSGKADLALLLRRIGELVPIGILEPRNVVDRVIEAHIDVVGLEAAQAAFQRLHRRVLPGVRPRQRL